MDIPCKNCKNPASTCDCTVEQKLGRKLCDIIAENETKKLKLFRRDKPKKVKLK